MRHISQLAINRLLRSLEAHNSGILTQLPALNLSSDQIAHIGELAHAHHLETPAHQPSRLALCDTFATLRALLFPRASKLDSALIDWHLEVLFGGDSAADTCDLSSDAFDAEYAPLGGEDSILPGGFDQIPHALASGLSIEFGAVVTHIAHGGGDMAGAQHVMVRTADRRVHFGNAVIVTVPLGVLKAGSIVFDPPLPAAKAAAVRRMRMGTLVRVALEFDAADVFWPRGQYAFGAAARSEAARGEWPVFVSNLQYQNRSVLECMIGGPRGLEVERMSEAAVVDSVMEFLERLHFPSRRADASSPLPRPIRVLVTRWGTDPFTRGSYSYFPLGARIGDNVRLGSPVGRLLFAGEHTRYV